MKQHSLAEVAVVPAGTRDDGGAKLWRGLLRLAVESIGHNSQPFMDRRIVQPRAENVLPALRIGHGKDVPRTKLNLARQVLPQMKARADCSFYAEADR